MMTTGNAGKRMTRRGFIGATASALAVPRMVRASAPRAGGAVAPSNRLTMGLIGRGCMGRGHLARLVGDSDVQLLAVCDVDRSRCAEGKEAAEANYAASQPGGKYAGCAAYNDYRELLARKDIDAVVIATPDHWHTPISIEAVKAGKDVYCEKPVSMTVRQGRALVEAVRANKRVFQNGSQYRSIPAMHEAIDFVRAGGLGKVKSAFTLWGMVNVPTVGNSRITLNPTLPEEPVPEGLDWNLWVGPSPFRPYNHHYHRNPIPGVVPWTFCEDFGNGVSTNYHSHAADVIQYALGMEESGPAEIIHPSGKQFPTLTCRYANGTLLHHIDGWEQVKSLYHAVPEDAKLDGMFGGLFVGERGWLNVEHGGRIEGGPESLFQEMKLKTREVGGANNHHANWFECIRTRSRPSSHEEIGHRGASLGHLIAASFRLGRSLKWDPAQEVFEGDEEANGLLSRPVRDRREPRRPAGRPRCERPALLNMAGKRLTASNERVTFLSD
ncbi:MAG: Gfo/Idh/MocA family oxidoreductase [bacterium]